MKKSEVMILDNLLKLFKSSEKNYREGNFKKATKEKLKTKEILKSKSCTKKIKDKFKRELSLLYKSKFDLIDDHKKLIDDIKRISIIDLLEKKSAVKYEKGDYKGAIKALRRAEKYEKI